MGDVLPPKRQAVVDRLRRRIELYRKHQEAEFPRYDAASNALHEQQRRETLLLQQRFLEAKAKKAKKSDHKNANKESAATSSVSNGPSAERSLLVHKLNKRSAPGGSPLIEPNLDSLNEDQERQQSKIPRTSATPDSNLPGNSSNNSNNNTGGGGANNRSSDQKFQPNQQSQQLPSFSVQIVQQFTSSASPQSQHSQTIQTNVTVKALSNNIKSSNSPLANHSGGNQSTEDLPGASISVGTNFECKRERDTDPISSSCSGGNNLPTDSNQNQGNNPLSSQQVPPTSSGQDNNPPPNAESVSDRFAETLANLGFPDDSSDDAIHADILSDLFDDDIFTNSTDLMKEFNFDESSMKDSEELGNAVMEMDKAIAAAAAAQQQQQMQFQFGNNPSQTSPQGIPSVFENQSGAPGSGSSSFSPRMQGYGPMNPGVMDFKLREPSPAAQTLKQMAEQHQSMQQKQMGLGMGSPHHHHHHHPQSPFGSDSFTDPITLSSLRTNFLNGSGTSLSPLSKGPPQSGMQFPNMQFSQQQQQQQTNSQQQQQTQPQPQTQQQQTPQGGAFTAGLRPGAGVVFKQETNTGVYPGLANPSGGSCPNAGTNSLVGPRMSPLSSQNDIDMHKRQGMQMQRITPDHKPNPSHMDSQFCGPNSNSSVQSPVDQKPNLSVNTGQGGVPANSTMGGPPPGSSYVATRPLSHFSDPSSGTGVTTGNRQSPVSMGPMGNQFLGRSPASGMTPPPQSNQQNQQQKPQHFASSPLPTRPSSGPNIQMSQSQQLQINQGNQQLQVSQSQQFQISQDVKPQIHQQQQTQQQSSGHGPNMDSANMYSAYQTQQHQHSQQNTPFQLSMVQSQSLSFGGNQFGGNPTSNNPPNNVPSTMEHQAANNRQRTQQHQRQQQQLQQFLNSRPPPEYKPQHQNMQHNGLISALAGKQQGGVRYPQNIRMPMVPPYPDPSGINAHVRGPTPNDSTGAQLRSPDVLGAYNPAQMTIGGANSGLPGTNQITATSQNQQGPKANSNVPVNKPVYTSALSRNRAPNVNVGPEGLNISQRPPAEWRQMLFQQQQAQQQAQQHQIHLQQQQQMSVRMQGQPQMSRFPNYRGMQPNNQFANQNLGPLQTNQVNNPMGRGVTHHQTLAAQQQQLQQNQILHSQQQQQQQAQHHMLHIHQSRGIAGRNMRPQMMVQQQQQQMMLHQTVLDSNSDNSNANINANSGSNIGNPNMNLQMSSSQTQIFASMQRGMDANSTQDQTANGTLGGSNSVSLGGAGGAVSDPGQFSLDFLDSIEPTTSDLLNFDQISGAHFSLLDEMGILGK